MQHMPDKDFDKLFKDSFMDAEIEPSADLWGNIAEQLEPKKKRSFPVLWMAAASVTVVASVMLLTQNNEKVYLHSSAENALTNTTDEVYSLPVATASEITATRAAVLPEHKVITRTLLKRELVEVSDVPIEDAPKNNFIAMQPSEKNEHLLIKKAEVKPLDIVSQETVVEHNEARMIAQVDTKTATVDDIVTTDETSDNKKGIRNVGDLVNYVVDKVDKRDKKIIKFDTDDDDNSSIIGLNIGFLKLNKKNK
ncbi:hypothetical protein [Pedobacter sp. UBA4863]|uniref:hypothetical protein n=2 Tax=Pedobacter TaxID=84567 RepID=UPI0025D936CC|nr:hypothetical protein [Pedobacter sp. UBA4863]